LTSVKYDDFSSYDSIQLSRIIRDISAEEIEFQIENFSYKTINSYSWYNEKSDDDKRQEDLAKLQKRITDEKGLLLLPDSSEAHVANGLFNLGILMPEALSLGVHKYYYSNISVKLLVLLRKVP